MKFATRKLKFDESVGESRDDYIQRVTRELQYIDPSNGSVREQLREILEVRKDDSLEQNMDEVDDPMSDDKQKPTRHHKWRRWRNTGTEEEHGEAEEVV